jgi:hypothetical protein
MGNSPAASANIPANRAPGHLRTWLDVKKIQPSSFKITADGRMGFELTFISEANAEAFEPFNWPLP